MIFGRTFRTSVELLTYKPINRIIESRLGVSHSEMWEPILLINYNNTYIN